jgi:hypothetical protein
MVDVTLLSMFLVGLLGGVHCAGMCGGIVAVMGASARPAPAAAAGARPVGDGASRHRIVPIALQTAARPVPILLGYNLGRILSYTAAGAIAGAVGSSALLVRTLLPVQQAAFVLANLVLIMMGLYLTGALRSVAALEVAGRGLWRTLRPLAARSLAADRFSRAFGAGLVWGWVPCGMVYGGLIAALVSGSALDGALLMLAFGAGTLPNLLALGWSAHALRGWLASRALRIAAGMLVIAFGLAGLARVDPTAHLHRIVDACVSFF